MMTGRGSRVRTAILPLEQSVAAVPLLQGFVRVLGEVLFVLVGGDLAPRGGVVQHEADAFRRLRERGVYRRGEGVDEVGVIR